MENRHWTILGAAMLVSLPLNGSDFPAYERKVLESRGTLGSVLLADVDGDYRSDLIQILNRSESSGRRLTILLQDETLWSPAVWESPIPEDAAAFSFADVAGGPGSEWILFLSDGAAIFEWGANGYGPSARIVSSFPCLFSNAGADPLPSPDLLFDFDGDGRMEICFPSLDRLEVYRLEDGQFVLWRTYSANPVVRTSGDRSCVLHFPRFYVQDFDGDTLPDLWMISGELISVFIHKESVVHAPDEPISPDLTRSMSFHDLSQTGLDPIAPQERNLYPMDVDRDGCSDLILSRAARAAFTRNVSHIQIYLNRSGRLEVMPDAVLVSENFAGEHEWADLNADGLPDLTTLSFPAGITQAAHYLITGKAYHSLFVFFQRQDSLFGKPDVRFPISRRIRPEELFSGACMDLRGDFNGDGIPDLLFRTDEETVRIHAGTRTGFRKRGALLLRGLPGSNRLIGDWNRDGFSDLLFWVPSDGSSGRIHAAISVGKENR